MLQVRQPSASQVAALHSKAHTVHAPELKYLPVAHVKQLFDVDPLQVAQVESQLLQIEVEPLKNFPSGQHEVFPELQVRQPVASQVAALQFPVHAIQVLESK